MAELKRSELAQGTGMFNLTRQLGGSLGIAIMATLLQRFTAHVARRCSPSTWWPATRTWWRGSR